MERKRTTIAAYRGCLRRHLAPFFGDRPMDRVEAADGERYLYVKRQAQRLQGSRYAMVSQMSASMSRSSDRLRSPGEGPRQARPTTPGDL